MFLTKYMQRPLRLFGTIGIVVAAMGIVISLYLSARETNCRPVIGTRPLLLLRRVA